LKIVGLIGGDIARHSVAIVQTSQRYCQFCIATAPFSKTCYNDDQYHILGVVVYHRVEPVPCSGGDGKCVFSLKGTYQTLQGLSNPPPCTYTRYPVVYTSIRRNYYISMNIRFASVRPTR
jgi:hypothetical protein